MYPEKPKCHGSGPSRVTGKPHEWQKREGLRHCSYCGSLHPEDLLKLFSEGAHLEGADWKYGWPHKFYVARKDANSLKFYNEHLQDLMGEPEFSELAEAIYEKQNGEYYPLVAFTDIDGFGWVRLGIANKKPYAELVAWAKEQKQGE